MPPASRRCSAAASEAPGRGAPAPRPGRFGYLTAVLLVLPPIQALVFILVQQGLFGLYLGLSFARPNHKGMAMLTDQDELDYLRRQVLTSRNVRGGWFVDFARRPQLPDRAPPLPQHAPTQPALGPAADPGASPAARPGLYRGQPARLFTPRPSATSYTVGASLRPAAAAE